MQLSLHPKLLVPILVAVALLAGACGGADDVAATPVAASTPVPEDVGSSMEEASDNTVVEAGEAEIPGVIVIPVGEVQHTQDPVNYTTSPPAGGNHHPGWQNCGFYSVVVPNEQAVHSLEHGAVWVTYTDEASQSDLDTLNARAAEETHLLVTKYDGAQDGPLVVTAWGRQATLASATDPLLEQFMETYMFDGPTAPEPGVVCSGAFGIPPSDFATIG